MQILVETLKHSLMITTFVLVIMMVIEYITVKSRGSWGNFLKKKSWVQIFFGAFLGIMPGCLGSFAAVSLYSHKIIGFAALVTVMIATSGDEIFIMFAEIPQTALILSGLIFGIAIITGLIINLFFKDKTLMKLDENLLHHHEKEPTCFCFDRRIFFLQIKNMTFQRALLIVGVVLFLIFLTIGEIGPHEWGWEKITFIIVSFVGLFIITTVPDHFLNEHLWKHTIKKHLLKIFLWTFVAILVINIGMHYLNLSEENLAALAQKYFFLILIVALLVGVIPESGPHMVFIFLFSNGLIPFSILLANSIVQDGHGAIPLFAESKKSFFAMKGVNLLVGLIVGIIGYLLQF